MKRDAASGELSVDFIVSGGLNLRLKVVKNNYILMTRALQFLNIGFQSYPSMQLLQIKDLLMEKIV